MYGVLYCSQVDPNLKCLLVGFNTLAEAKKIVGTWNPEGNPQVVNLDLLKFNGIIVVYTGG